MFVLPTLAWHIRSDSFNSVGDVDFGSRSNSSPPNTFWLGQASSGEGTQAIGISRCFAWFHVVSPGALLNRSTMKSMKKPVGHCLSQQRSFDAVGHAARGWAVTFEVSIPCSCWRQQVLDWAAWHGIEFGIKQHNDVRLDWDWLIHWLIVSCCSISIPTEFIWDSNLWCIVLRYVSCAVWGLISLRFVLISHWLFT